MRAFLLNLSMLLAAACATPYPDEIVIDASRLDPSLAAAHAREAASRGDRRILGVYSVTTLFPGAGECGARPDGWWRHGQAMIGGTSDTPADNTASEFNRTAYRYAEAYNQQMTLVVCGDGA